MLLSKIINRECSGLIGMSVIYHTICCFLASEAKQQELLLMVIILVELAMVVIVSKEQSPKQWTKNHYRPLASHGLMLIFLVPMCLLMDTVTVLVDLDIHGGKDILWLNVAHVSVIIAKYAALHGRYAFLAYGSIVFIALCLLIYISSTYLLFFIISSIFLWKCIDIIPSAVPKCFTYGELAIVLQLFCSWVSRMLSSIHDQVVLNENVHLKWTGSTIIAAVIIASLMLGFSKGWRSFSLCIAIYGIHALISMAFLTWIFEENFLLWIYRHLFQDCTGLTLLISWILVFAVTIVWTVSQALVISSKRSSNQVQGTQYTSTSQFSSSDTNNYQIHDQYLHRRDAATDQTATIADVSNPSISYQTRKVFHLFILMVYIPGLLMDSRFLFLSSCVAFGAFIIFEAIRVFDVPLIGQLIEYTLRPFTDERDQGPLFLTHIYLLVGLSLPLWMTSSPLTEHTSPIWLYSGVLALGIGDTVACVAGMAYGKHRWPGTKKTVEGTVSAIAAQMMFVFITFYFDLLPVHSFFNVWTGITVTLLVEAFTDQIDNLVLPLVLFPFLCSS